MTVWAPDVTQWAGLEEVIVSAAELPADYLTGMFLSFVGVAAVDISAGSARDDDDADDIVVAAPISIVLPTDLDTGVEASDTWYHVWVFDDSTGVLSPVAKFSVSATAPTKPVGYDLQRRLGTVRNNDSSDILAFVMCGNRLRIVRYTELIANVNVLSAGAAEAATAVDCSDFVPPTSRLAYLVTQEQGTAFGRLFNGVAGNILSNQQPDTYAALDFFPTDATQNIAYGHSGAGGNLNVFVTGYAEEV